MKPSSGSEVQQFISEALQSLPQFYINAERFGQNVYSAVRAFYQLEDPASIGGAEKNSKNLDLQKRTTTNYVVYRDAKFSSSLLHE